MGDILRMVDGLLHFADTKSIQSCCLPIPAERRCSLLATFRFARELCSRLFQACTPLTCHTVLGCAGGVQHAHVPLCMELVWLTLNACPDNAPFLGDKGAVPVFAHLLAKCFEAPDQSDDLGNGAAAALRSDTLAHESVATVAALTLRALALVLRAADSRAAVADLPAAERGAFHGDLLRAAGLEKPTNAAAAALEVVAAAAASAELAGELLAQGALGHAVMRMLQCAGHLSVPFPSCHSATVVELTRLLSLANGTLQVISKYQA